MPQEHTDKQPIKSKRVVGDITVDKNIIFLVRPNVDNFAALHLIDNRSDIGKHRFIINPPAPACGYRNPVI